MWLFNVKLSKQIFHSSYQYKSHIWNTSHTDRFFTRPSQSTEERNTRHRIRSQTLVPNKLICCNAGKEGNRVIDRNSQEKKSSGRRVGLMRAAGPWMTVKLSVLSWQVDTNAAFSHEASSMPDKENINLSDCDKGGVNLH